MEAVQVWKENNRLQFNPIKTKWFGVLRPPDFGDFPSVVLDGIAWLLADHMRNLEFFWIHNY